MRTIKYLIAATVITVAGAACQGVGIETNDTFPPVSQPVTSPTPTTTPPVSTPTTTPIPTPTPVPAIPVSYLPDLEPDTYQVFGASGQVPATSLPGGKGSVVARLDSDARDIATTGRRASVKGTVWAEIKLGDGTKAWIDATLLVHQITVLQSDEPHRFVVTGLLAGQQLNVRVNPGVDHVVISMLADRASIMATGHLAKVQGAVWAEVEISAGKTGWVNASFLAPEVVFLADADPGTYQVTGLPVGGTMNVRSGPGVHTDVLITLAADAKDLASTGKRAQVNGGLWLQIKLSDGRLGWISATYVEIQPEPVVAACRPGAGSYCPELGASRGAVAAFISRAARLTDTGGKDWFTDDNGSVFEADINRLAAAGIILGCNPPENTRICPDQMASRAMAAAWFSRAMALTGDGGKDWFADDNGSAFEADINRLAAAGVARACNPSEGTRFCPNDTLNRGQLAAWTARAFGLPSTTSDYFSDDDQSIFEGDINAVAAAGITRI